MRPFQLRQPCFSQYCMFEIFFVVYDNGIFMCFLCPSCVSAFRFRGLSDNGGILSFLLPKHRCPQSTYHTSQPTLTLAQSPLGTVLRCRTGRYCDFCWRHLTETIGKRILRLRSLLEPLELPALSRFGPSQIPVPGPSWTYSYLF